MSTKWKKVAYMWKKIYFINGKSEDFIFTDHIYIVSLRLELKTSYSKFLWTLFHGSKSFKLNTLLLGPSKLAVKSTNVTLLENFYVYSSMPCYDNVRQKACNCLYALLSA